MIGSGLKKLAQEKGMKVAKGVAYGSLDGFAATMFEGSGYKEIVFSTRFTDPVKKEEFMQSLDQVNMEKTYRVQRFAMSGRNIVIVFADNVGTMKKISAFLDWFMPLLKESSATPADICVDCGTQIVGGKWVLIDGVAYCMHDSCAEKAAREIDAENTQRKEEDHGSYFKGTIGALIGSLLGSLLWAVILYLGYVASIVGFVIGWLAEKGYNLLHGKQGKGKIVILVIAVIFGVVIGNFIPDIVVLAGMVNAGELPGVGLMDIPMLIVAVLLEDPGYAAGVGGNILMGLLFAALGVYTLLRKAGKEVADVKYIELN